MMSDFRQAAIEALKALEEKPKALEDDYDFGRRQMLETCIDIIQNLQPSPSTQPERKTGKWIISNTNSKVTTYKCSECGRIVHDDTGYDVSKDYPYCHCGADMRGKQE